MRKTGKENHFSSNHIPRKTNITLVPTTIPNEQTSRNTPSLITVIQRIENMEQTNDHNDNKVDALLLGFSPNRMTSFTFVFSVEGGGALHVYQWDIQLGI
ncbi:hypothetical protein RF11_03218 [Thelohanellus kitauei]|uniref:Uncharacterized protein n=1 Tax=Thelohanellus kitauei TaxID=669202 RepID=A0A0C2J512_THEKT|nr:hypothetical protein RF11_03218 [Thelohanellus kitauei]